MSKFGIGLALVVVAAASFWGRGYFHDRLKETELMEAYSCGFDDATRQAQREARQAGFENYPAPYEKFTENFKEFPIQSSECQLFHMLHLPK